MKVGVLETPPSRAGSLPLIADDLALDFANTESGRGFPSHQNHLRDAGNVAEWLRHANALSVDEVQWLQAEVSARADLAADLLARANDLRSAIHGVGSAVGRSGAPPEAALANLAALHTRFLARASLHSGGGSCRWRWNVRDSPVEAAPCPSP